MAGKRQAVNQAAKKAASDGKVTQKEADKLQQQALSSGANNAAVAIARAAANNQARIAESVQQSLGIEQNKNLTRASTTQAPSGMDAYVSGFKDVRELNGKYVESVQKPVYTFQSRNGSTAKTTGNVPIDPNMRMENGETKVPDTLKNPNSGDQNAMNNQTNQWSDSVDNGLSELEAILKQQMEANAQQTSLYMGMMQDMMSQMTQAQTQVAPQGAYAVNTYQTPATGAQTTQEIAKRKPVANDSLSIGATPTNASGVGLNLAI